MTSHTNQSESETPEIGGGDIKPPQIPITEDREHDNDPGDGAVREGAILRLLAEELGQSSKRGRSALIVLLISTLILAVAAFNFRGTWLATQEYRMHHVLWDQELKDPIESENYASYEEALITAINRNSENVKPDYKRTLFHDVLDGDLKTVEVPALGLEFYIEDMPFLGAFGLLLVMVWFYFVRRRERGVMKAVRYKASEMARKRKKAQLQYLYFAASFKQVFNKASFYDDYNKNVSLQKPADVAIVVFSYLGLFMPVLVLGAVLTYDLLETYTWKSPNLLVPDEAYFKGRPDYDADEYKHDPKTYVTHQYQLMKDSLEESHFERIVGLRCLLEDSAFVVEKCDSSKQRFRLGVMSRYKLGKGLQEEHKRFGHELEDLKILMFERSTLFNWLTYEHEAFHELEDHSYRFIWNIKWEVIMLRTLFPIIMLALCLTFSLLCLKVHRSKERHFERLEAEYKKLFGLKNE